MEKDLVNSPDHYLKGRSIEPIDVIDDWGLDYYKGNILRYISRAGRKPGEPEIRDIKKAQYYVNRYLEILEAKEEFE